jgi:hypothetical protein
MKDGPASLALKRQAIQIPPFQGARGFNRHRLHEATEIAHRV